MVFLMCMEIGKTNFMIGNDWPPTCLESQTYSLGSLFALWKLNPRIVKNGCQVILSLQSQSATHRERGVFGEPNVGVWEPSWGVSEPPHAPQTVLGTPEAVLGLLGTQVVTPPDPQTPYWSVKR